MAIHNTDGVELPAGAPPPPRVLPNNPYEPFADKVQFCLADFTFCKAELSEGHINKLLEIFGLAMENAEGEARFNKAKDLYNAIDGILYGSAPWKCFVSELHTDLPTGAPIWQEESYKIWFRDPDVVIKNILSNPNFADLFNPAPYIETAPDGKRQWSDYMLRNFAWRHTNTIYAKDPTNEGSTIVYVVLGSDKTTVSVGTGKIEYWPLYASIGNLHNTARQGHCNDVVPIGFLSIPKGT